jgi:predicted N-formylglutamate amidohydrolase
VRSHRNAGEDLAVLVTCEHGGNRVPAAYARWFARAKTLLASHRGYDAGALAMARTLARHLDAELITATVSRLVIELNRSAHNPRLFSPLIRRAPAAVRRQIFARYYEPYWRSVETAVHRALARHARVVHIGSHSFTPVLDGDVRNADIGLLYDPARAAEAALCARWRSALSARAPLWSVRRNYPYAGNGDGLTTHLRRLFPADRYAGVELEINQRHPLASGPAWAAMQRHVAAALRDALDSLAR